MPITSFSTPSLTLEEKAEGQTGWMLDLLLRSRPLCLLTRWMTPGLCLHASVCRPERCLSSLCYWPAGGAECKLSSALLQRTLSP